MICAPCEDSDQPGHPPSLIRVFAVRMMKHCVLSYPLNAQRRPIRLGWSDSSLGTRAILFVLSCCGSFMKLHRWLYCIVWSIYKVDLCVTLIHYPTCMTNDIHPSNSLENIRQNHWTMKYRSLTHTYFRKSIFLPYWSIISSTKLLHQIVFKILSKITGLRNIGHWPTYIWWGQSLCHINAISQNMMFINQIILKIKNLYAKSLDHELHVSDLHACCEVSLCVILIEYLKYGFHVSNSLRDIRQNLWTMKYMSLRPTFILRSMVAPHWLSIKMFDINPS